MLTFCAHEWLRIAIRNWLCDMVLVTPTLDRMQTKLEQTAIPVEERGLRINKKDYSSKAPYCALESVQRFAYLWSSISNEGGSDEDVEVRIRKAKGAFAQLKRVWESSALTRRIKLTLFYSIVKSVLLFVCETWRVIKTFTNQLQVFVNNCLRSILRIFWPDTTSIKISGLNVAKPPSRKTLSTKWRWIGHTLRPAESTQHRSRLSGDRVVGDDPIVLYTLDDAPFRAWWGLPLWRGGRPYLWGLCISGVPYGYNNTEGLSISCLSWAAALRW